MTLLTGPTDASNFRVKVGRYGDRFYTDPLPGCDIAPMSGEWVGPSVSTTKPPFANKYVPMRSVADMSSDEWKRLAELGADARYEAIKAHEKLSGRVNMDRGSIVHQHAEDRLRGRTALFADPSRWAPGANEAALRFLPALDAFLDTYQPRLVAAEVVCLHRSLNGVGYGGTADAFVEIEGDVWAVDWKSRNSDHGAYLEEAAQGGAYIGAEYMIVAGSDGQAVRAPMPEVAGVLIVSIREDGYRAFPIDKQGAIDAYRAMHAWWCAQRDVTDRGVIGKPWAPRVASSPSGEAGSPSTATPVVDPPPTVDRRQRLRDRFNLLNDADRHEFRALLLDPDDLDAIEKALDRIDQFAHVKATPEPVGPKTAVEVAWKRAPDEGADVGDAEFEALSTLYDALTPEGKAWFTSILSQAMQAGVSFHGHKSTGKRTVRRFEIYRGLLTLAGWVNEFYQPGMIADDELVRSLVATVWGNDLPFQPIFTTGHVVGAMSATEAARFAELCVALRGDVASVDVRRRPAA